MVSTIHQLRDLVVYQEYITWICQKFEWSEETFHDIAWKIFDKAMEKFQGHQKLNPKYIHSWLPVAEMFRWYNYHKITTCWCCRGQERQEHVLRCPGLQATEK